MKVFVQLTEPKTAVVVVFPNLPVLISAKFYRCAQLFKTNITNHQQWFILAAGCAGSGEVLTAGHLDP